MARTRQTARKSTGGMAPRANMASNYSLHSQMETYNETKTRSIEVLGEAEFDIPPDEVKLTFKIKERAYKVEEALRAVIEKLKDVRAALNNFGITNDNISSDSVNIMKDFEFIRLDEDGKEKETITKEEIDGSSDEDDFVPVFGSRQSNKNQKKEEKQKNFKKMSFFNCSTIIRIYLNKDTIDKFSETMFLLMTMGLQTHKAPIYDLSDFTEHRAMVRTEATKNAYEKAKAMIDVLSEKVELGAPIALRDISLNVEDDADDSFEGQYVSRWWSSQHQTSSKIRAANEEDTLERSTKKAKKESTENEDNLPSENDEFNFKDHLEDLFVVPRIRIMACVPIVFELIPREPKESESGIVEL